MAQRKRKVGASALAGLDAGQLAELKLSLSEREWARIRTALVDMSSGLRVKSRLRRAGNASTGEERWTIVSENDDGGYDLECYIYHRPPDTNAIRLLVEQNVGRAATREQKQIDRVVNLIHMVPRPGGIGKVDADGEPLDEPGEDGAPDVAELVSEEPALEIEGERLGYGAVAEPIYSDDPEDEGGE